MPYKVIGHISVPSGSGPDTILDLEYTCHVAFERDAWASLSRRVKEVSGVLIKGVVEEVTVPVLGPIPQTTHASNLPVPVRYASTEVGDKASSVTVLHADQPAKGSKHTSKREAKRRRKQQKKQWWTGEDDFDIITVLEYIPVEEWGHADAANT